MTVMRQSANIWRYTCMGSTRANGTCRFRSLSTNILDAAVWSHVTAILTDPSVIEHALSRLRETDASSDDPATLDRSLAGIVKRQGNLARVIAQMDDEEATEPLTTQLAELAEQKRRLVEEQAVVLGRREQATQAHQRLQSVQAWARNVAERLDMADWDSGDSLWTRSASR